jgi:hypothetical protein
MEVHRVVGRRGYHILVDSRITDGGEVVSPTCRPPFTPRNTLVFISVIGRVDPRFIVGLEGLGPLENPVTSSGIEPATFRLVAYEIHA